MSFISPSIPDVLVFPIPTLDILQYILWIFISLPLQLKPPSSCELDDQHACLDYASAAQCNTLNYCQYVVWNAPVQENNLCQLCMDDVDKLRDFLDSNTTREHVESELLIICKLIPWQSLKFKVGAWLKSRYCISKERNNPLTKSTNLFWKTWSQIDSEEHKFWFVIDKDQGQSWLVWVLVVAV